MAKKEESSNSTNLSEETKQMTQRSSSQKVKEIKEKDLKDEIILTKKDMKKTDTPLITGQESEKELKESNNKQKKDEQTINNENTKVKFKTEIINKDININNSYEKEKNPYSNDINIIHHNNNINNIDNYNTFIEKKYFLH